MVTCCENIFFIAKRHALYVSPHINLQIDIPFRSRHLTENNLMVKSGARNEDRLPSADEIPGPNKKKWTGDTSSRARINILKLGEDSINRLLCSRFRISGQPLSTRLHLRREQTLRVCSPGEERTSKWQGTWKKLKIV